MAKNPPKSAIHEERETQRMSCWGRLRFRLKSVFMRSGFRAKPGSFRYDPLSYSQNFDEGKWEEEEDVSNPCRGFSARFAPPAPKPPTDR
ncbi:hypothetical protein AMTRI_Chr13g89530 [Amborella trichopoda]